MQTINKVKDIYRKYNFILTKNQKRWAVVVFFLTLIGAGFETLGVSVILPLVQAMIAPEVLWKNPYVALLAGKIGISTDIQMIEGVSAFVIGVYFIKNAYLTFLSYVRAKFSCKIQRELSIEMMKAYIDRGYPFFLKADTGELIRGIITSVDYTYQALYQVFRILAEITTVAFICVYIMCSDWFMAVCIVLLILFCLLVSMFGFKNWMKKSGETDFKYSILINSLLIQSFQGIKEVLVMNRQDYFVDEYKKKYVKRQASNISKTIAGECPSYIIEFVCVAGIIITVFLKAFMNTNSQLLIAQLAAFGVAIFRIMPSLGRMSQYFNQFVFCVPSINDTYSNLKEVRGTKSIIFPEEDDNDCHFENEIFVDHIDWHYEKQGKKVLNELSMHIQKGESIALVGQSGAGKTTLSDIILGLLVPQNGKVYLDGKDIYNHPKLRSKVIGFVPQSVYLINASIRKNIAFGLDNKDIDDKKVWKAIEQAQLKDFIENLPEQLDTHIGERGVRLSGGQRQRIAIARALYCDPEILVLDEATSALDSETETAVMESIDALQGSKTLIIIAHRLTTIKNCNKIYEIKDGKAVERKYEELVEDKDGGNNA